MPNIPYLSDTGTQTLVSKVKALIGNLSLTSIAGTLTVAKGGTGATTEANARSNLSVYSKTEVDNKVAAKQTKVTKVTQTVTVSSWVLNSSTGFYEYSLQSAYPAASYNLSVDLNWDTASTAAATEWVNLQVVGSNTTNKIVARSGDQPTCDLPLVIYVEPST